MDALQVTWFGLIGVLLAGYIILDGFDLGVGFLYLFTKKEADRRALMASISPYWDGNEVWLLTGGGALFAAFPKVYATVFSGFYLALMLVLFALIFRAVSIEFRSHADSPGWKRFWDGAFAFGSIIPALLLGVAMGNIVAGLRLNAQGDYTGTFLDLLNPYSLLLGVTGLAMFAAHGALFAAMRTKGGLSDRAKNWAQSMGLVFCLLLSICFIVTIVTWPRMMANFHTYPVLWALPVVMLVAAWSSWALGMSGKTWRAFLLSSGTMVAIIATIAAGTFPYWVWAPNGTNLSLTVANASSSPLTLKTMLILALIGMPIVLAYTIWVHRVFRGKVEEGAGY